MTHKNKKGFTLVELLSVIIIISVIAIITVPIIGNLIESSKKSGLKSSATQYIKAVEEEAQLDIIEEDLEQNKFLIKEDGSYIVNGKIKKLTVKGNVPSNGTICVNQYGDIESYSIVMDGYVISNTNKKQQIKKGVTPLNITCNVEEEIVEIENPENSGVCSQTKKVVINYPEYEEIVKEYRIDNGEWKEYAEPLIIKENGTVTVYARLRDTRNNKVSGMSTLTLSTLDNQKVTSTAPTVILSEEKPTSEINVTFNQIDNCGLKEDKLTEEEKKKYGISETKEGPYTWQEEAIFSGLKNNTTYYIKTRANDIAGNGIVESEISEITTGDFEGITITPNSTNWTTSKTVTIAGTTKGSELQYKIVTCTDKETCTTKTDWIEYSENLTINWTATTEKPTYVYARFYDGKNYSNEETLTVTTVDTTAPSLTLGPATTTTTKSIIVPINTNSDDESGIKNTTCKLGTTSGEYTIDGTISNNACTSPNLTNNTTYYYKVTTTNNAGKSTTKTGSAKTGEFEGITITPSSTNWTTSKTVTITGTTSGATLQYRVLSGSTQKVAWTTYNSAITINWAATTETPTYVYARFYDGKNYSEEASLAITTIDVTAPGTASSTIRIGSSTGTVRANTTAWTNQTLWWGSFTATDTGGSGVSYYQYSTNCTGTASATLSSSYTYSSNTNYKFCIRAVDAAGNPGAWSGAYYIKVDKTAPTTPTTMSFVYSNWSTYGGGWTNQAIYAARTNGSPGPTGSTDTGGSGVAKYQISSDGSNWVDYSYNTSSSMYVFNTTGTHTRYFRAVDAAGNVSGAKSVTAYIDKNAPSCTSSGGNASWTNGSRTLTGTCSDTGGSGCKGNASKTYSSNINSTTESPGTVSDNAGNSASCPSNQTVRIDKSTPSTPTIKGGSTSWKNYNQIVWVTSSSSSASGIKKYQYCIMTSNTSSGCSWSDLYNNTAGVTTGIDVAYYHAAYGDLINAFGGNVTSLNSHYSSNGKNEGRSGSNSSWLRTAQNISTNGIRYVFFRAVNNVGTASAASNGVQTSIDTIAPEFWPTITNNTDKKTYATLTGWARDVGGSGVNHFEWKNWYSSTNITAWSSSWNANTKTGPDSDGWYQIRDTWTEQGNYWAYMRACDNVGNCSDATNNYVEVNIVPSSSGCTWTTCSAKKEGMSVSSCKSKSGTCVTGTTSGSNCTCSYTYSCCK